MKFQDFALPPALLNALAELELERPTPMQSETIPPALQRRDVIGRAENGSGKTAAFLIPMITRLARSGGKRGLILVSSPARALRATRLLAGLTRHLPEMRHATLVGGSALPKQVAALQRDPRIIVATPERLVEHLKQGNLSLSAVEIAVLDEADEMLGAGFASQLTEIHRHLPKTRQTLLFHASTDVALEKLASRYLKDPIQVTAAAPTAAPARAKPLRDQLNRQKVAAKTRGELSSRGQAERSSSRPGRRAPQAVQPLPQLTARHC
jgi:superfamily II DNA/RNA helicase